MAKKTYTTPVCEVCLCEVADNMMLTTSPFTYRWSEEADESEQLARERLYYQFDENQQEFGNLW